MITVTPVGPTRAKFSVNDVQHSTSGRILSLALSPANPSRIYAGSFAGVWRSDDGGENFRQMVGPLTDTAGPGVFGGVYAPHVFDITVSPTDSNLVLAGARDGQFVTSRDGIYRSADGGVSWELVLPVITSKNAGISQITFAPDDTSLLFAAVGFAGIARSTDAGKTWQLTFVGSAVWHVAVAPLEGAGARKVYATGDSRIFFSPDGGDTWMFDQGVNIINTSRSNLASFQSGCGSTSPVGGFAGRSGPFGGDCPQILAVEPDNPAKVYLATQGGSLGPVYYDRKVPDGTGANTTCERLAGEGSIWQGDFSQFAATGSATWTDMPGPPLYTGAGDTPSGNMYAITKATSFGFLLFFSDTSHIHVCQGPPDNFNSWHRLGGKDVSQAQRDGQHGNVIFVHADPHALIFTPDFEITLKPAEGVPSPFDACSDLDQFIGGRILMANDGGVDFSDDGGQTWNKAVGLETLDPINLAGLFGLGDAPALYFGCGDNDDFFTRDGGASYGDPISSCGDCDGWFSDVAQPSRVMQFEPRFFENGVKTPKINIITSGDSSKYPDPSDSSSVHHIPATRRVKQPDGSVPSVPVSDLVVRGFRPIIQTLATESPMPDGDYVFMHSSDTVTRVLLRTTNISSITQLSDWDDTSKAQPIGTPFPNTPVNIEPIVQVSGGHFNPVFYVTDDVDKLRKWDDGTSSWKLIVPGGPTGRAATGLVSFFVDPYRSEIVYLVDKSGIKVSLDGGDSWIPELGLTQVITAHGKIIADSPTTITDMLFSRGEAFTRFAMGDAGVFGTINGVDWFTIIDAIAVPGRPECAFFDPITDPNDRALYVEFEGRSLLRFGGLPGPPPFEPPPVFDLFELAAILEA